jgi:hypothetical protein
MPDDPYPWDPLDDCAAKPNTEDEAPGIGPVPARCEEPERAVHVEGGPRQSLHALDATQP